jgi:hypothetical protein
MCNPNIAVANRRPRAVLSSQQLEASSSRSSILSQNLLGSFFRDVRDGVVTSTSTSTKYTVNSTPFSTDTAWMANGSSSSITTTAPYVPLYPELQQLQNDEEPPPPKAKPKRRRKPQRPGKTAKQNDRHFVIHNYHDHASDQDESATAEAATANELDKGGLRRHGGISVSFPLKLHDVLDQVEADGLANIISWQHHGRCFAIHKPKEFVNHVMPTYFRQTKLTSFQRQLNLYGFNRLTRGSDNGGYYHELFLRGKTFLCKQMIRTKVKGTRFKAASSPEQEPDFYTMVRPRQPRCVV